MFGCCRKWRNEKKLSQMKLMFDTDDKGLQEPIKHIEKISDFGGFKIIAMITINSYYLPINFSFAIYVE
jgi:hypothetical protein